MLIIFIWFRVAATQHGDASIVVNAGAVGLIAWQAAAVWTAGRAAVRQEIMTSRAEHHASRNGCPRRRGARVARPVHFPSADRHRRARHVVELDELVAAAVRSPHPEFADDDRAGRRRYVQRGR